MQRSRLTRIAMVLAIAFGFIAFPSPSVSAGGAVRPPVIDADLPDPALVWTGEAWYVFGTNTTRGSRTFNVPAVGSYDLVHFSAPFEVLPTLGSWADPGFTWAPAPVLIGSTWVLYYTAHDRASNRQCIGSATSTKVTGPYRDDAPSALVCQVARGGSIDPSSYVSSDGQRWLAWKSDDNAIGNNAALWSATLAADGRSLTSAPNFLLQADTDWEASIVEAPYMVRRNDKVLLFYSGNWFLSDGYAEGYAICSSAAGPCTKQTVSAPWMQTSNTGATGPGGASFVPFGSYAVMAFHSWRGSIGPPGWRAVSIEPVDLTSLPDWQPGWTRGLPSGRLLVAPTGTYVLGRYGDVHPYSGPDNITGSLWTGWQIVRGGTLNPTGTMGLSLDGWGGLHPFRIGTGAATAIGGGGPYWPGYDIARDVTVTAWGPARGYVLDGWGALHPFGTVPAAHGTPYWPGSDIARRVGLLPSGTGGYVLDGWGALHPFALGAGPMPAPVTAGPYWPGSDTATAVAIDPAGDGGYVLDNWGGLHPFAIGGAAAPPRVDVSYYVPNGGAVDVVVTDWSGPSGYTLDSVGSRHPFGATVSAAGEPPASSATTTTAHGEVLRGCRSVNGTVRCTYATPYGGFVER